MTPDTSQRTVQVPTLKFAEEHIGPILRRQKTATIRHFPDGPSEFNIGTRFHLADEEGDRFASAIVSDRGYNDAEWIVKAGVEGHRDYRAVEELLEQMRRYYPDAVLGPDSCFEIIYWGKLWK